MKAAVRVASAAESADAERATIENGTSSGLLMRRAGEGAAAHIALTLVDHCKRGVAVFVGSGNNGGDGWIVASALARAQIDVRVLEVGAPRSEESQAAKRVVLESGEVSLAVTDFNPGIVVDALLGTGSSGAPRGIIADAIARIGQLRSDGAKVVALDLPSGLDATTGEHHGSVVADATVSFGTTKRGHLISRGVCGDITIVDIGLDDSTPTMSRLPVVVDARWVHDRVPAIAPDAHKGTRKRLAIVGGGKGMAGAAILAGEGALRAGIGLLRLVTAPENAVAIHAGLPAALFQEWPESADGLSTLARTSDTIAIGPGLGASDKTRDLVERLLVAWSGPVVLDADALNIFAGDASSLAKLLRCRPAIITPHPAEMGRLLGIETRDVLSQRFEAGIDLARQLGAAVLLKGTPTVIFSPTGARYVSASGTAALATGGSGDVLTGIAATLLAQMSMGSHKFSGEDEGDESSARTSAAEIAACAAFTHGRAAELCVVVRGTTLDDVIRAIPQAWNEPVEIPRNGVLGALRSFS